MERDGFYAQQEALHARFGRERALLPIGEVAAYLGVDRRTLLHDRSFPVKKIGNQYRVPLVGLARWMNT